MIQTLWIVFGDQLDPAVPTTVGLDPEQDALWMAEVDAEITSPPSHKRRIALFLSAMRHYRDARREEGWTVHYHELTSDPDQDLAPDFAGVLAQDLERLQPERIAALLPGDHRVLGVLRAASAAAEIPLDVQEDPHFLVPLTEFREWARGRKRFLLEDFYRWRRKETGILMQGPKEPVGGEWNYDGENRETFGKAGPPDEIPPAPRFPPDALTRQVLELVESRFGTHPGSLEDFAEAVTPDQAREALDAFITQRLPRFGTYQDALWEGEPFLYHSRISAVLNLKLLAPGECVQRAEDAYHAGAAPLNAVEGFIRQILGWREYIRGIYWRFMPDYADGNALECDEDSDVPSFFWDGETDMACVADAMDGVLRYGYAHHIQRLMVLGLFALLKGVHPYRFHEWHMALYLDAVDWVSLPNTLGMSQYGDGGRVGSKPYCASGRYIDRMSNHCSGCRYEPGKATGDDACPFTTLYWDFLDRHQDRLDGNRRMGFQLRNLERKDEAERQAIREQAAALHQEIQQGRRI